MGANDVRAGGAFVEIGGVTKGMEAALDRAAGRLKAFGASVSSIGVKMAALGAAVKIPLELTAKAFASMGDELAKAATRTGIGVEEISALAYAAKQSGTDLEGLENGLRHMSKTIVEAAQGSQQAQAALTQLGVNLDDLRGKSPDEQFKRIGEQLSRMHDPTLRAALAMQVFGKSGTQLIPLLADGRAGVEALEKRARELGLTWSTVDARAAEEFNDRLDDLWNVMKRATATIGSALVPVLRSTAVWITENVVKISAWISQHRQAIVTALQVAGVVLSTGLAFIALGKAISLVGFAVGGVSSTLTLLRTGLSGAATVIATIFTSAIGVTLVALAALGGYLLYTSDVGKQALSGLGEYFSTLKDTAQTAMQGIKDALASGDFKLAAQILWLGIKVAFAEGIAPLKTMWAEFKASFVKVAVGAFDGFLAAWDTGRNFITEGWIKTVAGLKSVWAIFTGWLRKGWEEVVHFVNDEKITESTMSAMDKTDAYAKEAIRHQAAIGQINGDQIDAIVQANQTEKNQLKSEAARHHNALLKAGEQYNETAAAADANAKGEIQKDKDALKALEKDLQDATGKAKTEAAAKAQADAQAPVPPKLSVPALPGLDSITSIFKSIAVAGTFSGAGARGLGAGNPAERTAKATESTARIVAQILQKLASAGPLKFT